MFHGKLILNAMNRENFCCYLTRNVSRACVTIVLGRSLSCSILRDENDDANWVTVICMYIICYCFLLSLLPTPPSSSLSSSLMAAVIECTCMFFSVRIGWRTRAISSLSQHVILTRQQRHVHNKEYLPISATQAITSYTQTSMKKKTQKENFSFLFFSFLSFLLIVCFCSYLSYLICFVVW